MSRTSLHKTSMPRAALVVGILAVFCLALGLFSPVQANSPTVVQVPPIPAGITHTDPCGPNNANWNQPPDSVQTAQFMYSVDRSFRPYHLIVTDYNYNEQFPAGEQVANEPNQHDYGPAHDSGVACPAAVYAPHGKIIVRCNLRVSYVMDNRASNRTVLYAATWSYGTTKVIKRVYVKAHTASTLTLYKVHRYARATLVARSKTLAAVAHVGYWRC